MPETFKRSDFLKLTGLTRVQFDTRMRRALLPGLRVPSLLDLPEGLPETAIRVIESSIDRTTERMDYSARAALLTVVMDDIVRSYWGQQDLAGAYRLVVSGMSRLGSGAAKLAETNPKIEIWLGAGISRLEASEIVKREAAMRSRDANDSTKVAFRDAIEGSEPPILGTLADLLFEIQSGSEPSRLVAVNVSASYRLLKARAEHHGIELPSDLNSYAL